MSRTRLSCALALSLFTAGLGSGAFGQSQTGIEAARADGKAFGGEVLGKAQTAAKTQPTADRVPGFGGTPSQSTLFDDPDAIARQAATAASSNDGYATVRSSLDSRPRVAVEDIEATIARGRTISDDPAGYVSGMSVGGGQGNCRELPPSSGTTGTYEATCNDGVALEQRTASCTIPLSVSVTRTTGYRYWCSDFNAGFNRVDDCRLFEQASCQRTGSHEGRCLQGRNRPPYEWCTEPGEPIHELL